VALLKLLITSMITLSMAGAIANDATNPPEKAKAKNVEIVKDKNGVEYVCKRIRPTGSRIKRKVCLTQRKWDDMASQNKKELRRLQDQGSMQKR